MKRSKQIRSYEYQSQYPKITYINYDSNEIYLDLKYYIQIQSEKNPESYLKIGDHSYQFEFTLPNNLPSSFSDGIGKIKYTVKATIDIPMLVSL